MKPFIEEALTAATKTAGQTGDLPDAWDEIPAFFAEIGVYEFLYQLLRDDEGGPGNLDLTLGEVCKGLGVLTEQGDYA